MSQRDIAASILVAALFAGGSGVRFAKAQESTSLPERVLVVVNTANSDSKRVADHYMAARGVPAENKCGVKPYDEDDNVTLDWKDFEGQLKPAIRRCLERAGMEKILYILMSYKLPFKLAGVAANHGVSLDQYLSDIWDQAGPGAPPSNPYYAAVASKAGIYPKFISLADYRKAPLARLVYSVWRLDGPTRQIASALVDKAITAEKAGPAGQACFDRRFGDDISKEPDTGYSQGDWDLLRAAQFSRAAGLAVTEDTHEQEFGTPPAPKRCDGAILYSGWYSLDHYNDAFSWNTGAIGFHLDSASAANPREGANWSAGALQKGITITAGAVEEPFLPGLPRPAGIVRDLFHGATVGDAFFRNTQWIRWMIIYIGDPLYRPFSGGRGEFSK